MINTYKIESEPNRMERSNKLNSMSHRKLQYIMILTRKMIKEMRDEIKISITALATFEGHVEQ